MQNQILNDIGSGSIFSDIITINEQMSKRLAFKVDLQEALFRQENGEIYNNNDDPSKKKPEQKRLSKADIKMIIQKKMLKVERGLDAKVKDIQKEGRNLAESIDQHS